ncbi:hypothetical protein LINPERPRIM_LOCUS36846, partial [Linum perenne]
YNGLVNRSRVKDHRQPTHDNIRSLAISLVGPCLLS